MSSGCDVMALIYLLHGSTKHAVALVDGDLDRPQEPHLELLCPAFLLGWRKRETLQRTSGTVPPASRAVSYLDRAPRPPPPRRRREICRWSRSSCCSRDTTGPPTGPGSARGRLSPGTARPRGEGRTWRRGETDVCFCSASSLLCCPVLACVSMY